MTAVISKPVTGSKDHGPAGIHANRRMAGFLERAPAAISAIAAALGLISLTDALAPHRWQLLSTFTPILPGLAKTAAEAVVAVSGLLLLRISRGLRQRKRAEWRLAVALCVAITLADVLRDERRPVEAAVSAALLVALVTARSRFVATADPRNRAYAIRVSAQFLLFAVVYGLVLLYVPGHVSGRPSFVARLTEVVQSMVGLGGSISIRGDHYADVFHATLLGLGLLTAVCAVVFALRPVEPVAALDAADEASLRVLLAAHGARDSLGYFALRRDKSVVWSPTAKAAITYRVVCGVALVSGDPIGDPEAWPGAIAAYRALVEHFGWTPAVMGCSELGATVMRREMGLAALMLGDEAILFPQSFSLLGRAMRGVRQACTRVERAGYVVCVRRVAALDTHELGELRAAADAWRAGAVERGYSMALSRLGDPADPRCVVVTAHRDGHLAGLLHFVPWSEDGISLDLMRRDRASDNGLNEFMIARLMQAAPELGIERVSLNFAVFRDALERGERIGAGPVLRLWRRVLIIASRWWQIESLYRFNAKFRPVWEPRFFCYPRVRDVPRIALAALEAEAFIVRPQRVKKLLGRA